MNTDVVVKGLQKFAVDVTDPKANAFGICNARGELVTREYLARYVQCWCRKGNGFNTNRKSNFEYFASDEFLTGCIGLTASQVGKRASISELWGLVVKPAGEPATSAPVDTAEMVDAINERFESVMAAVETDATTVESQSAGEPVDEGIEVTDELAALPARKSKKQRAAEAKAIVEEAVAIGG